MSTGTKDVLSKKVFLKPCFFVCFAVKQKFYGHLLVTRIFHPVTENHLAPAIKKLISDPAANSL